MPSLLANETEDVIIQCSHDGTNLNNMLWYQQKSMTGISLIGYIYGATGKPNYEDGFNDRFKLDRKSVTEGSLVISKLLQSDSAVYYCAASQHSATHLHNSFTKTSNPALSCLLGSTFLYGPLITEYIPGK